MERKNLELIGYILLGGLFLGYLHFYGPEKELETASKDDIEQNKPFLKEPGISLGDYLVPQKKEGQRYFLENQFLRVAVETENGQISEAVILDKKKPAFHLVKPEQISWRSLGAPEQRFLVDQHASNATTLVLKAVDGSQSSLKGAIRSITYKIRNHQLFCDIQQMEAGPLRLSYLVQLDHFFPNNSFDSRYTAIQYLTREDKKILSIEPAGKMLLKSPLPPLSWLAYKQRFYTLGLLPVGATGFVDLNYSRFGFQKELPEKKWGYSLVIATLPVAPTHQFAYYFGPNKRGILSSVAPFFGRNHYQGPILFREINQYIIQPIFATTIKVLSPLRSFLGDYLLLLALLLLVILFKLLQGYIAYQAYINNIKKRALAPELEAVKAPYKDQPVEAQAAERAFYKSRHVSVFPPSAIIGGLLQLPLFLGMMHFLCHNIDFKYVHFLWIKDISLPDHLFKLPFKLPFLGSEVSLLALIMAFLPLLLSYRDKQQTNPLPNQKYLLFLLPLFLFLMFNNYPAIFCLYRIMVALIDRLFNWLLSIFVDEEKHRKAVLVTGAGGPDRPAPQNYGSKLPRALIRWQKKKGKKK